MEVLENSLAESWWQSPTVEFGECCLEKIIWDPEASVSQTTDELTAASELLAGREKEFTFEFGSLKAFGFYRVVVSRGGLQNLSGELQDKETIPLPGFW